MSHAPWYKRYPEKILADTDVQGMTDEQAWWYSKMLDLSWVNTPHGYLSNDIQMISRMVSKSSVDYFIEQAQVVLKKFKTTEDGKWLYHPIMLNQAMKMAQVSENKSHPGKSGRKKKNQMEINLESDDFGLINPDNQEITEGRLKINPLSITSEESLGVVTKAQIRESVQKLFSFYCQKLSRNEKQYTLTPIRKKKAEDRIEERLKVRNGDIEAVERECILCVENLANSEWHVDGGYIDWVEQIFRSAEAFEKRLNWKPAIKKGAQGNGIQEQNKINTDAAIDRRRERRIAAGANGASNGASQQHGDARTANRSVPGRNGEIV